MLDQVIADRVLSFMRLLKDPKGGKVGQRKNIVWLPWQEQFFTDVFATIGDDGLRQYREAFVEIPRKNGKTTMIAACVLYQLFMSDEYGQEIYSAANDRTQAARVFEMASSMIRANSALSKRCRIYDSTKRIVRYKAQAAHYDEDKAQGAILSQLQAMNANIAVLAEQMKQISMTTAKLEERLADVEKRPARRWDAVIGAVIAAVVGVAIGFLTK